MENNKRQEFSKKVQKMRRYASLLREIMDVIDVTPKDSDEESELIAIAERVMTLSEKSRK